RERALDADRPRFGVRHLQVRLEDVHGARRDPDHRIDRRRRERSRAELAGVPEQERQRTDIAKRRAARRGDLSARVPVEYTREIANAVAAEGQREAPANDGVAVPAEDGPAPSALRAGTPGEAEIRREGVPIGVERLGTRGVLHELR